MIKKMMNRKSRRKAFTLIELIIVMAIIAILAAIAVPQYMEIKEKSKVKTDIASAKLIYDSAKELMTDDKLALGGNYTLTPATVAVANSDAELIMNNIDDTNIWPKSKDAESSDEFRVAIATDGTITVSIVNGPNNVLQAYPDLSGATTNKFSSDFTGKYRN